MTDPDALLDLIAAHPADHYDRLGMERTARRLRGLAARLEDGATQPQGATT